MLFLNSETENLLYSLDLTSSNHASEVQVVTYLPKTLEFCWLFSQLYLRAEPLVRPRGLQTFQKTFWRPNEWQKNDIFNANPTRYLLKKTKRNPPAVSESQRECPRTDAHTYLETCMPSAIDWFSNSLFWCNISDFASSLLYISPQTAELGHQRLQVVVPRQDSRS